MDLHEFVKSRKVAKEAITTQTRQIYEAVLDTSPYLTTGNFRSFHPDDLQLLFQEYDQRFLDGHCRETLGDHVLQFRISKRMTKAAGSATPSTLQWGRDLSAAEGAAAWYQLRQ